MKSLSLYQEGNSFVHNIDPINKLIYIVAAIAITAIIPNEISALACILVSFILICNAKIFKKVMPIINFSLLILISIVIIQGLFFPENKNVAFSIGKISFYKEGLYHAFLICLRVINILCAFSILVLTTSPSDLIEELVQKGLSPKIGYVLSSVLQIIPQMTSTMETIMDAQKSRGMETEGKLTTRLKAFFPLIGPVVMNSLIATRERAIALEVRGFSSTRQKTFLNERVYPKFNGVLRISMILLIVAALVGRVVL
ncbi:energy-coupling factor transporter transmembrane component T [Clostridium sp. OS1-26]|uniref:energy-coupling factor transporter transmembrane component T family protein n=1 Tax=Clostridium sp. OS1-26 TaxID=3070681 RepID=UPI0027E11119|nr:energy-coupling factor transporter transmembrane component T [Clostridium sp. OS1-26]WML32961.1 energy-coupling factor transporter transmembrane component T [Clostridium sp. OS1-26]